jgi:EXLDI family protein
VRVGGGAWGGHRNVLDNIRILLRIVRRLDGSYDADVPNKTIYVSDGDMRVYQRAQELSGGNLSAAIAAALRRYIDVEEGRLEGFKEVTLRVGPGKGRKVRFTAVLLGDWGSSNGSREEHFRVYRSRKGKFVLHVERSPDWTYRGPDGKPAGWRSYLGLGAQSWGFTAGESTLEVFDSLEALRDKVPPELYEMVAGMAEQPDLEDLDI